MCVFISHFIIHTQTDHHSSTGFKVLSEAERTAALYSLLQHSTPVQIRFFITVLQQMARADPMTAVLSPSMGGQSIAFFVHSSFLMHMFQVRPCKMRWKRSSRL
jgi:hypothetical protein